MRKIIFRAYTDKNEIINDYCVLGDRAHFIGKDLSNNDYGNIIAVVQYTGLKDKNGVMIFEGDIVRILYTDWPSWPGDDGRSIEQYKNDIAKIGHIVYVPPWYGIKIRDYYDSMCPGKHGFIEVIGNIYTTPELIKIDE